MTRCCVVSVRVRVLSGNCSRINHNDCGGGGLTWLDWCSPALALPSNNLLWLGETSPAPPGPAAPGLDPGLGDQTSPSDQYIMAHPGGGVGVLMNILGKSLDDDVAPPATDLDLSEGGEDGEAALGRHCDGGVDAAGESNMDAGQQGGQQKREHSLLQHIAMPITLDHPYKIILANKLGPRNLVAAPFLT